MQKYCRLDFIFEIMSQKRQRQVAECAHRCNYTFARIQICMGRLCGCKRILEDIFVGAMWRVHNTNITIRPMSTFVLWPSAWIKFSFEMYLYLHHYDAQHGAYCLWVWMSDKCQRRWKLQLSRQTLIEANITLYWRLQHQIMTLLDTGIFSMAIISLKMFFFVLGKSKIKRIQSPFLSFPNVIVFAVFASFKRKQILFRCTALS